jgi:C-terminal processing protease CtpA/Prc
MQLQAQDPSLEAVAENLTKEQIKLVVEKTSTILDQNYLFPDLGTKYADFIKTRWKSGAYSDVTSMKEMVVLLTDDLYSIHKDKHLTFSLGHEVAVTRESMQVRKKHLFEINYGFNMAEILCGNVAYLEIVEFCAPDQSSNAMAQAFASLEGCDTLIIDIRHNKGGAGDLIHLICAYFFEEATHLYDVINPRNGRVEEVWSATRTGPSKFVDKPLYILTSQVTYSAAECLAYSLQALKRAVIVGENSAGGAHPTRSFIIREVHLVLTVPVRDIRSPVTGGNWEGTGVKPDITVPAEKALEAALAAIGKTI